MNKNKGISTDKINSLEKYNRKEWVCLVDLQKQIKELKFKHPTEIEDLAYNLALNNVLELCNSSEQKKNSKDLLPQTSTSVSDEHNTRKKCTCPTERFWFKDKCTICGGRCGGAL